jgi:hypothetical protein
LLFAGVAGRVPTAATCCDRRSSGVEGGDAGRRLDLEGGEDRVLGVGGRSGLLDGAGGALQGDEVEALQLGRDPPPAFACGAFGDPDQQQGERADDDVGADSVFESVEDGAQLEGRLQVAEGAFGLAQVLVAERDLLGGEVGVGGGEQVLAVQALLGGDLQPVTACPSATRSGGRCHPPKLDAGDVDSGRGPTVDRRSRLACLLLGVEQDNREALAFGGL